MTNCFFSCSLKFFSRYRQLSWSSVLRMTFLNSDYLNLDLCLCHRNTWPSFILRPEKDHRIAHSLFIASGQSNWWRWPQQVMCLHLTARELVHIRKQWNVPLLFHSWCFCHLRQHLNFMCLISQRFILKFGLSTFL